MAIAYMCSRIMLGRIGQFHQEKYTEGYYTEKKNHSSLRKTQLTDWWILEEHLGLLLCSFGLLLLAAPRDIMLGQADL